MHTLSITSELSTLLASPKQVKIILRIFPPRITYFFQKITVPEGTNVYLMLGRTGTIHSNNHIDVNNVTIDSHYPTSFYNS